MAILITSFAALLLLLLLEPDVQLPSPFIQATNVPYPDTSPSPLKALNITTIATTPQNESAIECWQLAAPLQESTTPGTAGAVAAQLGNTTRLSYSIIPTRFDGGLHNAPAVQWVAFLSGVAVISLPNSTTTATIPGGRDGLILATDVAATSRLGHITRYPSDETTVVLQAPLVGNAVPEHRVLYKGGCGKGERRSNV